MSQPTILPVSHPTGQYNVIIGEKLLPAVRKLAQINGPLAVVTDNNIGPLYANQLGDADCLITIPAGEQNKTLDSINIIYDQLLAAGFDRKGTIVGLGGGVIGDMAGFAAATYMRGVNFVQCPTSLLAMVDASVGAKTGVDLSQGKNLVGAFKQPTAVIADISTLQTLPKEELASGMAEIVKHGLIASPELFQKLATINNQQSTINYQLLIHEAILVKRDVVQEDPFEQGRRAVLNLGHTFGHAIEQVSGYAVRHGEGVAMGLVAAANLSARLEYCDPALQTRIEAVLQRHNLPTRIPANLPLANLYKAMSSDKKKEAGKLRFILLRDVGDVFMTDVVGETARSLEGAGAVMETLSQVRESNG